MPQAPPWWWQQQWQATNPGLPTPTGAGPGGPETGGASYQNVGGSPSYDPYSSGPPSSTGGVDLPQINPDNIDMTSAPFGSPGQGGPGSYPSATPYPDAQTFGQYMGPHYQVQGVNFQDPMTDYAPPPADIYGPSTDTNNYSPAGDGGRYVYDQNWNYLSYEPPPDSSPTDPSTVAFGGDQGTGTISGLPGGDVPLLDGIPTASGEEPPVLPAQDVSWTDNPPGSGLLGPDDAARVGATMNPIAMPTNWGGFAQSVNDFFTNPGYSSPDYLRSIGYQPGQGTGSLWPDESGARGGPLPGSEAGLGSFSGGVLPGYGYDIGGLHKPFTPEQYANLPSQFQSPFTAGFQQPSYAQYLAAWQGPPTSNAQPGDEQPGDTGFPTGLVHSGQHIAPR